MKFKAEHLLFLAFLLSAIIVPPFLDFLFNTHPPQGLSFLGFINDANREAWIGYYGAIIGGALTLGGVWWTIKDQDKKLLCQKQENEDDRLEQLSLEYKPILSANEPQYIRGEEIENGFCDFVVTLYNYEHELHSECNKSCSLLIANIGRGEAILKNILVDFPQTESIAYSNLKSSIFESSQIIGTGMFYKILLVFSELKDVIYLIGYIPLRIKLTYYDFIDRKEYINEINLKFAIEPHDSAISGMHFKNNVIYCYSYTNNIRISK